MDNQFELLPDDVTGSHIKFNTRSINMYSKDEIDVRFTKLEEKIEIIVKEINRIFEIINKD